MGSQSSGFYEEQAEQLIRFAEKERSLSRGGMRESLAHLWQRTGIKPADLCVECPECYMYLWEWFCDLQGDRQVSYAETYALAQMMNGKSVSYVFKKNHITYTEILAWSQLTGNNPTPEDVRLIKKFDAIMRSD